MRLYGEIQRVDEEQRMVWGHASTEQRAQDGLVITRAAVENALDDYMAFANIREMHQLSAVGVAREASFDDEGLFIGAHIVDDTAWSKVTAGVYRGFSLGAKITERDPDDKTLIRGIRINEISLVDRPADPGAVFSVWRAAGADQENNMTEPAGAPAYNPNDPALATGEDLNRCAEEVGYFRLDGESDDDLRRRAFSQEQREKMAKSGEAMSDGSFPIANRQDLENAIRAFGRAKNKAAAKRHIMKRAKALDAEDLIPDDWKKSTKRAAGATTEEPEAERTEEAADPVAQAAATAQAALAAANQAVDRVTRTEAPAIPEVLRPGLEIRRGMGTVSQLNYLLCELAYLATDAQWESEIEGDNSSVPGKLRAALLSLASAYRAMSEEELSEMLNGVGVDVSLENGLIALAAATGEIARADAQVTPEQGERLQAALDGLIARGWKPIAAPAAEPDELQRAVERVTAMEAQNETLLRTVGELTTGIEALTKRVEELADQPSPPKTIARAVAAVSKEEDATGTPAAAPTPTEEEVMRALDSMSPSDRAMLVTKAALARPIPISR